MSYGHVIGDTSNSDSLRRLLEFPAAPSVVTGGQWESSRVADYYYDVRPDEVTSVRLGMNNEIVVPSFFLLSISI